MIWVWSFLHAFLSFLADKWQIWHCDNTRIAMVTQEKLPPAAHWKCPVASISPIDDYWWRMRITKSCPMSLGEFFRPLPPKNSVLTEGHTKRRGWGKTWKCYWNLGLTNLFVLSNYEVKKTGEGNNKVTLLENIALKKQWKAALHVFPLYRRYCVQGASWQSASKDPLQK